MVLLASGVIKSDWEMHKVMNPLKDAMEGFLSA